LLLTAILVGIGLAGCASQPDQARLNALPLNEGGQKLTSWQFLFKQETDLGRTCLLDKQPAARAAEFDTCYAAPLTKAADDVAFPLKTELNAYLASGRKLAATGVSLSAADYRREHAKLLDVFIVSVNRYLADTTDYFSGPRVATLGDPLIAELKKDEVTRFIQNTDINILMGLLHAAMVNNVRIKIAERGLNFDNLDRKMQLTEADKRLLSSIFISHLNGFFTYEDLRQINAFYTRNGEAIARRDQSLIYATSQASSAVAKRKMLRAVSRGLMELGTSPQPVKESK
jgi:hypothetical protein